MDVNVTVNITDSQNSDLTLTLISPTGTQIILANQIGGTSSNFNGTTFDDQATVSINDVTNTLNAAYLPANPLAVLNGSKSQRHVETASRQSHHAHRFAYLLVAANQERRPGGDIAQRSIPVSQPGAWDLSDQ